MLTRLREQSQSFLIFILFGMLIVVFIFFFGPQSQGWKPGGGGGSSMTWAARINGQEIPLQDIEIAVRRHAQDSMEAQQVYQMRSAARRQIMDQVLLEQSARKMGLTVSETDVTNYITGKRNPDFGAFRDRKGSFSYERYQAQVTQGFGARTEIYREAKGRELLLNRYLSFLSDQIKVSEAEVKAAFEAKNRKWNLEYLMVDPLEHAKKLPELKKEDGLKYAAAHEEEIKGYYEDNKKQYDREKEIKIRRILLRLPPNSTELQRQAVKKKAEALLTKARKEGADFAKLASESSEGYYKDYKGDMGWQNKANSGAKGYEIYVALEKGQISTLQEDSMGYWFVKAEEIKPAIKKALEEVKGEIGLKLAKESQRKRVALKKAQAMLDQLKGGRSMAELKPSKVAPDAEPEPAPEDQLLSSSPEEDKKAEHLRDTGLFSAERSVYEQIPGIGKSQKLAQLLPNLKSEASLIQEVIEADGRFFLVQLKERIEPDMELFAKEKVKLSEDLRRQQVLKLMGGWRQSLFGPVQQREMLKQFVGGNLQDALPGFLQSASVEFNPEALPAPREDPEKPKS